MNFWGIPDKCLGSLGFIYACKLAPFGKSYALLNVIAYKDCPGFSLTFRVAVHSVGW